MSNPSVIVGSSGAVTTVVLNRPACRNAVDGATAARELADAFRAFDADDDAARGRAVRRRRAPSARART